MDKVRIIKAIKKQMIDAHNSYCKSVDTAFLAINNLQKQLQELESCDKCELCLEHSKDGRTME